MRRALILANLLAPVAAVLLWWGGAGAWAIAPMVLVHAATLWATLWPASQWWGPQQSDFPATGKELWLTLDDGPDPDDTPTVLDALDAHGAKATFFLIGKKAAAHPGLVREIIRRGHTIGNHTQTHPQYTFWRLGTKALAREIDDAARALEALLGRAPGVFRAPAGMRNGFLHPLLAQRGLRLLSWTVRGLDGRDTNRDRIIRRIVSGARPGAILLLHEGKRDADGRSLALDCVPAVLSALTARGYRFVIPD
ncbi:MAG: polysaccharide deacetylase family protein [Verrucomicrobiales bacterium]